MEINCFSRKITVFHERLAPEEGFLVGYGAIIENYKVRSDSFQVVINQLKKAKV